MRRPVVAISKEVAGHHIAQHRCEPDVDVDQGDAWELVCPCGVTSAIMCARCDQPVLMDVNPGEWCEHAEMLWREFGRAT